MGRYAFFNTGFEYKFWFAIQPSDDILAFGGHPNYSYEGPHAHQWTRYDKKIIELQMKEMESSFGLDKISFDLYSANIDGTNELYDNLLNMNFGDSRIQAKYILACILYHQLLYREHISCTYEV